MVVWKDEKHWLEALFGSGELMVGRRDDFQRVYDLSHRVVPTLAALDLPDPGTVHAAFVEQSLLALGISQARWINDYFRIKPRLKDADLDTLVDQRRVIRVQVAGWTNPAYVHAGQLRLLHRAARDQLSASHTALLSPFDPLD